MHLKFGLLIAPILIIPVVVFVYALTNAVTTYYDSIEKYEQYNINSLWSCKSCDTSFHCTNCFKNRSLNNNNIKEKSLNDATIKTIDIISKSQNWIDCKNENTSCYYIIKISMKWMIHRNDLMFVSVVWICTLTYILIISYVFLLKPLIRYLEYCDTLKYQKLTQYSRQFTNDILNEQKID